ncbi:MAG: hypothetical protein WED04_07775 [Promethearchaeati archaeon SRVP18_Atabeyarchaeia-1]
MNQEANTPFKGLAAHILIRRVDKQNKGLLLKVLIVVALVVFVALGVWGMTLPADASIFTLVYALCGLPYLLLLVYVPYRYRKGIYALGETGRKK